MPPADVSKAINSLSIDAIIYQVKTLEKAIKEITPDKYSDEACQLAALFFCITKHINDELVKIIRENSITKTIETRARDLALITQKLFSFLRYLKASTPENSPPGIQISLNELIELHFPVFGKTSPLCLVRPQWNYNLTYVPFSRLLEHILPLGTLDPLNEKKAESYEEFLKEIWNQYFSEWKEYLKNLKLKLQRKPFDKWTDEEHKDLKHETPKERFPEQLAVLSFAGLDTEDSLMYPLLAHELGHFIDLSFKTPKSREVFNEFHIPIEKIEEKLPDVESDKIEEIWNDLNYLLQTAFQELIADLLAVRMMGLSFFISLSEFLKTLTSEWPQETLTNTGYPGIAFRLKVVFDELIKEEGNESLNKFLNTNKELNPDESNWLINYIEGWNNKFKTIDFTKEIGQSDSIPFDLLKMGVENVFAARDRLREIAEELIPTSKRAKLTQRFFHRIKSLNNELPPFCDEKYDSEFSEILSAAWLYQLIFGDVKEQAKSIDIDSFEEYRKTCRLISKSIELIPARDNISIIENKEPKLEKIDSIKGVCSGPNIQKRMDLIEESSSYLAVIPHIKDAVQAASLDVHLGNWFAVARRTQLSNIDLRETTKITRGLLSQIGSEQIYVGFEHSFVIHPGDFVLGITMEFFALPRDLMAYVEGKSSIGRLGLLVATATQVAPGFHGVIVLELANTGTIPIVVKPGMEIAQLVFHATDDILPDDSMYGGSYQCQIKPIH